MQKPSVGVRPWWIGAACPRVNAADSAAGPRWRTRAFGTLAATLLLALGLPRAASAQVDFMEASDGIAVTVDSKPFTNFYYGPQYPKPFLHPLRSADGRIVTRQFPMNNVAGETRDHPHHRGLFIGYGSISGINFWENEHAYTTPNRGAIVLLGKPRLQRAGGQGTISALFSWRDPQKVEMIEESQDMTFRGDANSRTIDFSLEFEARRDIHFDDTKEGFFAIRVADSMRETVGGEILNSHGAHGEKQVWGKRADWAEYSGNVDGRPVAILIFDHPSNHNHPPRWHARAYGLFAVNPFGVKDFDPSSKEEGGASLKNGAKLHFRYRVVISNTPLTQEQASRQYHDFAATR